MTQVFNDSGVRLPLTVIEAGPCVVVRVKTTADHGYNAVCVGYLETDLRKFTKPRAGVFKKVLGEKTKTGFKLLREFRVTDPGAFSVGQKLTVEQFTAGDLVDVVGRSKGRGFAGTIRRHNFNAGPKSHGSKNVREPGSIGHNEYPGRVMKGKRMPGHLGDVRVTVQRLRVYQVDPAKNLIYIVGAVPGATRGVVTVKPSVKA
jgi:large subunit ribosomal protein L3